MIISEGDKDSQFVQIIDGKGDVVQRVRQFNTETQEAEIFSHYTRWKDQNNRSLILGGELEVVTFWCNIIGGKAIDKRNGQEWQ